MNDPSVHVVLFEPWNIIAQERRKTLTKLTGVEGVTKLTGVEGV